MTRFDFANKLNSRLYLLSEAERRDIIDEYIGHIDQKMKSGQTEADAIKDFGDIDDLAEEILAAYHIDSSKLGGKTIDIYIRQVFDYFGTVTEKLLGFSTAQLARIFVEFVVLLIMLNLLRYPAGFCAGVFTHLFSWLPYSVYHIIDRLFDIAANVFCIFLSFVFIYQFINKRIVHGDIIPAPLEDLQEKTEEKVFDTEKIKTATARKMQDTAERIKDTSEKIKEKSETAGRSIVDVAGKTGRGFARAVDKTGGAMKKLAGSTGDFVINLSIILIKIMLFLCLWIPSVALTIAGIVCTVLAIIVYLSTGIGFIGVCIAGVGCCVMGGAFTLWLSQMLTGGKAENA